MLDRLGRSWTVDNKARIVVTQPKTKKQAAHVVAVLEETVILSSHKVVTNCNGKLVALDLSTTCMRRALVICDKCAAEVDYNVARYGSYKEPVTRLPRDKRVTHDRAHSN